MAPTDSVSQPSTSAQPNAAPGDLLPLLLLLPLLADTAEAVLPPPRGAK